MSAIDEFLILFRTQVQDGGLNRLNSRIKTTRNELFSVKNLLRGFIGYDIYSMVRQFIPSMIDASKQIGAMESRFYAITKSSKLAAEELAWVKGQADRLGLSFLETADNYSIFYASVAKTTGGENARTIFKDWAEAFRVLHIAPAKQERVLYALREMSSKGKIYLQDLSNQLGSHVPAAMDIAAKSMGYLGKDAVGRFRKDITAGKIDVQKFLIVFSAAMNGAYVDAQKLANAMKKPDAQMGRMLGRWQNFLVSMSKAGFEKDLVKFLKGLNFLLGGLEKHGHGIYKMLQALGILLITVFAGKAMWGILGFLAKIIRYTGPIMKMLKFITGSRALQNILRYSQLLGGKSTHSFLTRYAAGIIAFITNPWVWVPLAIAAIALAFAAITKKYFPNTWTAIMAYWGLFEDKMYQLSDWISNQPWVKALIKFTGSNDKKPKTVDPIKLNPKYDLPKVLPKTSTEFINYMFADMYKASKQIGHGIKQGITNLFQHKTEIKNLTVNTNSDNPSNIASAIKQELDKFGEESNRKQAKTFGEAVAASRANSQNPFGFVFAN